ncbi:MAG: 3'-5' exonuclease [Spirochaetia bacterium]|nr:3'-5' exonuclease [Spirochaetia bacterium]
MTTDFLQSLKWVSVDIETNGLNPWKHEIIEIGAVLFNLNGILDSFQILIKPLTKGDPKARLIHNISNEELDIHGIDLHSALTKLLIFISNRTIIFHNAPFDLSFLVLSLNRVGLNVPNNLYLDNLYLSRKYFKNRESHSLASLRNILNIDTGDHHRALSDAEATAHVFINTISHFYSKINSQKKFKNFMRFNRKINQFNVKIPKNFDKIQSYFNKLIRRKEFIKIDYTDNNGFFFSKTVQPLEILVFNQKLYLKAFISKENCSKLIPIESAKIHDQDIGMFNF